MESKLEFLECHFTWGLNASRYKLFYVRDQLEDMGPEEGYSWLGHAYNLQGFIHHQLGFPEEALRFLRRATEAFRQVRNTVSDQGPWLLVNYGNLAWLHHLLGEPAESQRYLMEVSALTEEYLPLCPGELHPETSAEKAWTLMKFEEKVKAEEYFQKAVRMQPDVVEWQTSRVLVLAASNPNVETTVLEKMKIAKEHDPGNLYLASVYLEARAARGEEVEVEARALARKVLKKPLGSYGGMKPLLRLYRRFISIDEAIDLAEEALERHPHGRYLKKCAATCYRRRIFNQTRNHEQSLLDRAIALCKEVIALYPHSSLPTQIHLAGLQAQSDRAEADRMFKNLLKQDLDPEPAQMLYHCYARYLHASRNEESFRFHMMAASIPHPSTYRRDSILSLRRALGQNQNKRSREIQEFLTHLDH